MYLKISLPPACPYLVLATTVLFKCLFLICLVCAERCLPQTAVSPCSLMCLSSPELSINIVHMLAALKGHSNGLQEPGLYLSAQSLHRPELIFLKACSPGFSKAHLNLLKAPFCLGQTYSLLPQRFLWEFCIGR